MTKWLRYAVPAAAVASIASPAYAIQYLSIGEAQKQAFPSATQFTEVQAGRVWKAEAGGRGIGFFVFDRVVGKHLFIDYAVALSTSGVVQKVEILQYRESYGGGGDKPRRRFAVPGKARGSALTMTTGQHTLYLPARSSSHSYQ